jgi:hypothetical protein
MTSSEGSRQVFIIRIWCETREVKGAAPAWRGAIECVENGERRSVKNLDEIVSFIAPYLEKMGMQVEWQWRMRRWFSRQR